MKNSIKRAQSQACLGFAERKNFRPLAKQLKKLSLTLLLLITAAAGAWADDTDPKVTTNAASEQDLFTTASFKMPASDVTVNYTLVRDMQDATNPVAFKGLPTTTTAPIIVKKGDDGKYQPIEALTIQLIDPLISGDNKNIINANGITIKVLVGDGGTPIEYDQENPKTLEAFLADMKPGYYWIKAEATDATSLYDGTVYSSEFTVVEQYDLTVKPANEYSKGKVESVTVGTEQPITPDANTGKATKTGIAPITNVKIKAKPGYIIEKVEAKKKAAPRPLAEATAADLGKIAGADGNIYDTKADAEAVATGNAVAMIAYVGTASDCAHGLAIALADESGTKNYEAAGTACSGKAAVTGGTWRLPSIKDWQYMLIGCGASESYKDNPSTMSYSGLASMLTTAQGNALVQGVSYWSSTGYTADNAWRLYINGSIVNFTLEYKGNNRQVRACLAF